MYHVVSYSTAMIFLTNMSDKCKFTSPIAKPSEKLVKDNWYQKEIRHKRPT
jgi:hypothetical protein